MGRIAKELEIAWNEASTESGLIDAMNMDTLGTQVKVRRIQERFYDLFFQKTGLHDRVVRGLFNDWNKLPHEEAIAIAMMHGVTHSFCAYMAEYIERKVGCAGMSTAYHHSEEEDVHGQVH